MLFPPTSVRLNGMEAGSRLLTNVLNKLQRIGEGVFGSILFLVSFGTVSK